jgi:signal transduction histidine kinase/CheY-like chemotaxis protein
MVQARDDLPTEALLDADFEQRLDQWGTYHRIGISAIGLALTILLLPQARWVQLLCGTFLVGAVLVLWLINERRSERFKARVRVVLMLNDVAMVSAIAYAWGTHTSPVTLMYLPLVVGWTLAPQRGLGKAALLTLLVVVAALLALESAQVIPHAPLSLARSGSPAHGNRLLFLALLASSATAVQGVVQFSVQRMREHGGAVSRLLSERQRQERETELSSQLEEAARLEALGRLSGGIAHDFNNLLMALLGQAELARDKLSTQPAFVARALEEIERAVEHGRTMTAQLLDFASRRSERPVTLDLNAAVHSASKLLGHLLRNAISLELELDAEPRFVRIDPSSFERALFNLTVNACDAMPDGGKLTLRVSREMRLGAERAVVSVEDQGTGIAEEDLPRIFEPFFTRKERGKGTGLGLASVYGIVRQNQGEIEVRSVVGKGTCFVLHFPLAEAEPRISLPPQLLEKEGSERILLVDDNAAVLSVVQAQLESAGYQVSAARSSEEALGIFEAKAAQFDLLVSDVIMPGLSGIELAHRVRERSEHIGILLISGFTEQLSPEQLEALRASLLHKPFSRRNLLAAVRECVQNAAPG